MPGLVRAACKHHHVRRPLFGGKPVWSFATRRSLLALGALAALGARASDAPRALGAVAEGEAWLEEVMTRRGLSSPLTLSRFVEPVYFLKEPFTWTPNPDNGPKYRPHTVPAGFITDLASIPPILFPWFRPDGEYAQAAILHDYLYWMQDMTREEADDIFRIAMRDLEVAPETVNRIFLAVRSFGQRPWNSNRLLRSEGQRRILKKFPVKAATRWSDWKRDAHVFVPGS